jgi:hypothetical protein
MALFGSGCPVTDRERDWIQDNLAWLRGQFGDGPLAAPVILPTSDWFPPPFAGTDDDVRTVVTRVAGYMGVLHQVRVEFSEEWDHAQFLSRLMPGPSQTSGAAGLYSRAGAEPVITLDRSVTREPARLLAVVAHELGHVRLLAEGRVTTAERRDHEPLTDLATVYLGMGIFSANAAFDFSATAGFSGSTPVTGWRAQRLGYLTEQMFGYALACQAVLRGEGQPAWSRYLDTNPRGYLRQGLRYLGRTPAARAALWVREAGAGPA